MKTKVFFLFRTMFLLAGASWLLFACLATGRP